MCGIFGIIDLKEKNAIDYGIGKKATSLLRHRGPDDYGHYHDEHVFLGHRRLSIVDLSRKGKQPMFSSDGKLAIVYNGEIYNFKELRKGLEKKYRFNTLTDTEVLIYLYKEKGRNCVKHLDGMFAFLIWDFEKKEAFIARDILGKKPFYYTFSNGRFYFSSEIKALFADREIKKEVDKEALNGFLAYDYVIPPKTMFKEVFELMPGHYAVYNSKGFKTEKFWELPDCNKFIPGDVNKIDELLKKAVEKRLMGDVDVGIFLSGGLDSSAVLSYVAEINKEKISSLSVGYDVGEDELKFAKIMADRFNTNHYEVILSQQDTIKILPEVVYHLDQPLAESTAVSYYFMSRFFKKKAKATVALSGEGSDELFLGYKRHNYMAKLNRYSKLKSVISRSSYVLHLMRKAYPDVRSRKYIDWLTEYLGSAKDPVKSYMVLNYVSFYEDELKKLVKDEESLKYINYPEQVMKDAFKQRENLFNKMGYFDYKVWLPGRLLMRIDKPSMAASVEVRCPFMDKNLIEYATSIDPKVRLRKKILINALKNKLPREITDRRKKGFYFPLNQWFGSELNTCLENLNEKLKGSGLFNNGYIKKLQGEHNKFRNDQKLWNLLMFQLWYEIYINGKDYKKIRL